MYTSARRRWFCGILLLLLALIKLEYHQPLSTFAFNFNLRRWNKEMDDVTHWDIPNDRRLMNTIIGNNVTRKGLQIFAQPEPCLSLKPAKHPTTWDEKCSR
jgi:hypothetical protein